MAVQGEIKEDVLRRLSRIEGQIKGLRRLVEEDTYCIDVLTQLSSVHEALRGVSKIVMRDHLQHCVTDALRDGDENSAQRTYQELMDVIYKFAK
ncbi:MAG TPA: metal-sensitive transcriptional regulator [Chthonomonadaceae bacterium]|jgi:DNA-binding FrmR family transcriptional regulator|nr:metal-sensitive transcriptional regulator [Chthonomonadaceae bacterium]